ncbi:hypothetical protein [Sessilibacter sp. MAH2]
MWVIDFEASGLSKCSYPIKVGITNGLINYHSLIKPMPYWQHWSREAEAIHGISRAQLKLNGLESKQVAHTLNDFLSGQTAYCDSIQWDEFWCKILFSDNGIHQRFEIQDIKELIKTPECRLESYFDFKNKLEKTDDFTIHRALDDAQLIWLALRKTLESFS